MDGVKFSNKKVVEGWLTSQNGMWRMFGRTSEECRVSPLDANGRLWGA